MTSQSRLHNRLQRSSEVQRGEPESSLFFKRSYPLPARLLFIHLYNNGNTSPRPLLLRRPLRQANRQQATFPRPARRSLQPVPLFTELQPQWQPQHAQVSHLKRPRRLELLPPNVHNLEHPPTPPLPRILPPPPRLHRHIFTPPSLHRPLQLRPHLRARRPPLLPDLRRRAPQLTLRRDAAHRL